MAGNRTRDGIRISRITNVADNLDDVVVRSGSNHSYVLNYDRLRPCPIDTSTNARTMVVPWLRRATGNEYSSRDLYEGLRRGRI